MALSFSACSSFTPFPSTPRSKPLLAVLLVSILAVSLGCAQTAAAASSSGPGLHRRNLLRAQDNSEQHSADSEHPSAHAISELHQQDSAETRLTSSHRRRLTQLWRAGALMPRATARPLNPGKVYPGKFTPGTTGLPKGSGALPGGGRIGGGGGSGGGVSQIPKPGNPGSLPPVKVIPDGKVVQRAPRDPTVPAPKDTAATGPIRRKEQNDEKWKELIESLSDLVDAVLDAVDDLSGGGNDDTNVTTAAGRALYAVNRFQPQELQGLIDPALWKRTLTAAELQRMNSTGEGSPRQCVWWPATTWTSEDDAGEATTEELPEQCFVDPAAGLQLLRGGQAPASELDLTLLRLGELSMQCARGAASFTRNSTANKALCPAGCTYIAPDPQDPASYTSCQLSYSTLYGSLYKHFVDTCPGSLAEGYMSCGLSEDDFQPTVSSPTALQQAGACSRKPTNGTGLQSRGCMLVRAAPGDPEGNYCVPRVWSNATVSTVVQFFAKDEPQVTAQDLERFMGTCGRDVISKVLTQCPLKHRSNATSCRADPNCEWEPEDVAKPLGDGSCVSSQQGIERLLMGGQTDYSKAMASYNAECTQIKTEGQCGAKKARLVYGYVVDDKPAGGGALVDGSSGSGGGSSGGSGSGSGSGTGGGTGSRSPPQGGSAAAERGLGAVRLAAVAVAAVALVGVLL